MASSNVSADLNIQALTNALIMLTDVLNQATTTPDQEIPLQETDDQ